MADALDACATLSQAAPLAAAAGEVVSLRRGAADEKLAAVQAHVDRLSTENSGLRATIRTLKDNARRAAEFAAQDASACDTRERQLRSCAVPPRPE